MVNDQIVCIDDNEEEGWLVYFLDFRKKFFFFVMFQYMDCVEVEVIILWDGYVDLFMWCMVKFVSLVFFVDFRIVMFDFFMLKWYIIIYMVCMIVMFEEYVLDYRMVLYYLFVDIFIEIFVDEFFVWYFGLVRNKGVKFRRVDNFQDKIFDDLFIVFEFFNFFFNLEVGNVIKEMWRVMEVFLGLLIVEKEQILDMFVGFKMLYWDLQISWVEVVLRSRDDFERSMLNVVKVRVVQMDVVRGLEMIMSKVKQRVSERQFWL